MRYINYKHLILFSILALLSFISCQEVTPIPEDHFSIDLTDVTFDVGGGMEEIMLTSSMNWAAVSTEEWVSITPTFGVRSSTSIKITAVENDESKNRTAKVIVTSQDGQKIEVKITQNGKETSPSSPSNGILVSTVAELHEAAKKAKAGDHIVMKNGVWGNIDVVFEAYGTADNPITLRAETPGKVIVSGLSSFILRGEHIVLEGLNFKDGYSSRKNSLIEVRSSYTRITDCSIVKWNKPDGIKYPEVIDMWIELFGSNNRVDHCYFEGKNNMSVLIIVWGVTANDIKHRIDNNHFKDMPVSDAKMIRIACEGNDACPSYSVVENNLFEDMLGIGKIINFKTGGNIVRNNTFLRTGGAITLRHGNGTLVEGNYIISGMLDSYTGGILVIGEDHIIRNNYIQGIRKEGRGAIVMYEGQLDNGPGVGGNNPTKNVLIEGNTLVDNAHNIIIGAQYLLDPAKVIPVENITYRNNAIVGNRSDIPVIQEIDPPVGKIVYEGNYFYNVNMTGLEGVSGITNQNPELFFNLTSGLYKYGSTSPLIGNIKAPPLTPDQVGVSWK